MCLDRHSGAASRIGAFVILGLRSYERKLIV